MRVTCPYCGAASPRECVCLVTWEPGWQGDEVVLWPDPSDPTTIPPVVELVKQKIKSARIDEDAPRDAINPPHYRDLDPQPITVIEAWGLGFRLSNVIKYVARAGRKGGPEKRTEDLKKALFYLTREIEKGGG